MTATKEPYDYDTDESYTSDGDVCIHIHIAGPTNIDRELLTLRNVEDWCDALNAAFAAGAAAARAPLVEVLRECEWVGTPRRCPTCGVHRAAYISHAPGCQLAAAINTGATT